MTALDTAISAILGNPTDSQKRPNRDGVVQAIKELYDSISALQALIGVSTQYASSPADVATTGNVNLAGGGIANGVVIDGVTLVTGKRVLVRAQTAGAENGPYTVPSSGAASRTSDANIGTELVAYAISVTGGTANGGKLFYQNTPGLITLGTTVLNFIEILNINSLAGVTQSLIDYVQQLQSMFTVNTSATRLNPVYDKADTLLSDYEITTGDFRVSGLRLIDHLRFRPGTAGVTGEIVGGTSLNTALLQFFSDLSVMLGGARWQLGTLPGYRLVVYDPSDARVLAIPDGGGLEVCGKFIDLSNQVETRVPIRKMALIMEDGQSPAQAVGGDPDLGTAALLSSVQMFDNGPMSMSPSLSTPTSLVAYDPGGRERAMSSFAWFAQNDPLSPLRTANLVLDTPARSGTGARNLDIGSDPYEQMRRQMAKLAEIADAANKSTSAAAIMYQGSEQDMADLFDDETFLASARSMFRNKLALAKSIFGVSPVIFARGLASQAYYGPQGSYSNIPCVMTKIAAQVRGFYMSHPGYIIQSDKEGTVDEDQVHSSEYGYRYDGALFWRAWITLFRTGVWKPLEFVRAERVGSKLIALHAQGNEGALQVPASSHVLEVADGFHGFEAWSADNSTRYALSDVRIEDDTTVILQTASAMPVGAVRAKGAVTHDARGSWDVSANRYLSAWTGYRRGPRMRFCDSSTYAVTNPFSIDALGAALDFRKYPLQFNLLTV